MTAPNTATEDNPRQEYTLEEMEESTKAPAPEQKPEDIKTPEGKTLAEVLDRQARLEESLRLSESARIALQEASKRPDAPAPVQQEPQREPLTREKLAEVYQEDPIRAMAMMQDDAIARAAEHFDRRLNQLQIGTVDATENWARQEFKEEFEILGSEIEKFKGQIPDQSVFTQKKSWEDLISYVRGQKGNFEKLMEHKQGGEPRRSPTEARQEAEMAAGFTPTRTQRSQIPTPSKVLDTTTQRIAENLFPDLPPAKAHSEYVKWANISQG